MKLRGPILQFCLIFLIVLMAGGCKLVKNDSQNDGDKISSVPGGNMVVLVDDIWEEKILTYLEGAATDMAELAPALDADLQAAGEAYGYRPSSEGSPWNFATHVSGVIVAAKTDTRAATVDVDVDDDGVADAVLQLGPVIRGTAIRDVLPFIDFTSFTDQIEYAQLSRALNNKAYENGLKDFSRDNLVGQSVDAVGAFTMRGPGDAILVTPVKIEVSQ